MGIVKVKIMRVVSKSTVAVAVTLATMVVCFFGIRAELNRATQPVPARTHDMRSDPDTGPALTRDYQ
jgi:hypothetical protein